MKEVLAKEGYFKAATVRKIFGLLEEEDLTPDEVSSALCVGAPILRAANNWPLCACTSGLVGLC